MLVNFFLSERFFVNDSLAAINLSLSFNPERMLDRQDRGQAASLFGEKFDSITEFIFLSILLHLEAFKPYNLISNERFICLCLVFGRKSSDDYILFHLP